MLNLLIHHFSIFDCLQVKVTKKTSIFQSPGPHLEEGFLSSFPTLNQGKNEHKLICFFRKLLMFKETWRKNEIPRGGKLFQRLMNL